MNLLGKWLGIIPLGEVKEKQTLMTIDELLKEKEDYRIRGLMIVVNIPLNSLRRFSMKVLPQAVLYREEKMMERFMAWMNEEFEIQNALLKVYKCLYNDGTDHFIRGMGHYYKTWQQIWLASCHQALRILFNPLDCIAFEDNVVAKINYYRSTATVNYHLFAASFFMFHVRDTIMLNMSDLGAYQSDFTRFLVKKINARKLISSIIIPEDIQRNYGIETKWGTIVKQQFRPEDSPFFVGSATYNNFLSGKDKHKDLSILQLILTHSTDELNEMGFPLKLRRAMEEQKVPPKPCSMNYTERVAAQYAYKEACDQFGIMDFNFCNKDLDLLQLENVGSFVGKLTLAALYTQRYILIKKRIAHVMSDVISMTNDYYSEITPYRFSHHIPLNNLFFKCNIRAFGPLYGKLMHTTKVVEELKKESAKIRMNQRCFSYNYAKSCFFDYDINITRFSSNSLLDSINRTREPHNVRSIWMMEGEPISRIMYLMAVEADEAEYREMLNKRNLMKLQDFERKQGGTKPGLKEFFKNMMRRIYRRRKHITKPNVDVSQKTRKVSEPLRNTVLLRCTVQKEQSEEILQEGPPKKIARR